MGYNPNQPRSANGRFAGGGGGSSGSGGGGKKRGRPAGASGRKVGTRAQQQKNAAAQAARSKAFSSKAAPNAAKDAYKLGRSADRWAAGRGKSAMDAMASKPKRGAPSGPRGGKVGSSAQQKKAAAAQAARSKAFSSKAAPNTAKAKYKAARSQVRELKMYRGGKTDATVKKAQARVARMEKSRKSSRARV